MNATRNAITSQRWKWNENENVNMNEVCACVHICEIFIVFHLAFYFVSVHTILSVLAKDMHLLLSGQKLTSHSIEWNFHDWHSIVVYSVSIQSLQTTQYVSQAIQSCHIKKRAKWNSFRQPFGCLAAACHPLRMNRCTCSHKQTIQMLIHKQITVTHTSSNFVVWIIVAVCVCVAVWLYFDRFKRKSMTTYGKSEYTYSRQCNAIQKK